MEGHNWFLGLFIEIPQRSLIACFLSRSAKAGLNLPLLNWRSAVHDYRVHECKLMRGTSLIKLSAFGDNREFTVVSLTRIGLRTRKHKGEDAY